MKVKALLEGAVEIGWFAKVIGNIWTREYQKRGLPHIHLLLIFPPTQKVSIIEDRSFGVGRASSSRKRTSF
jgi:hypothetical protein